jgi:hypothetical protein
MKYYAWVENDPSLQTYEKAYALFRVELGTERIITDWWNPEIDGWEHHPGIIAVTSINGASNYHEVDGDNVELVKNIILKGWSIE